MIIPKTEQSTKFVKIFRNERSFTLPYHACPNCLVCNTWKPLLDCYLMEWIVLLLWNSKVDKIVSQKQKACCVLCYIENIHKCYVQNAEMLCSKYRNVMLKMQKCYAQNAETFCLKMYKTQWHAQNAEMLCLKWRNFILKMRKRYAWQFSVIGYMVRGQAVIRELT